MPVHEDKQRTMRDLVLEGMSTRGLEEVPCVEFVLKDGSVVQVLTDSNPVLNRPASDASSMKFKTSAEAGSVMTIAGLIKSRFTSGYQPTSVV